jgi:hypothetical protein
MTVTPPDERRFAASSALVWGLGLAQLVGWGTLYFAFSLFVEPMEAELIPSAGGREQGVRIAHLSGQGSPLTRPPLPRRLDLSLRERRAMPLTVLRAVRGRRASRTS